MVVVLLGKPSSGPIHSHYVPSIFSFKKATQSVPSTRYLRAVKRSRTRSTLISKCCEQPSTEVIGEKAEGDDAIDFTETTQGQNDNEAVASCSISTEAVDEIMDGVNSRDLAGTQVQCPVITVPIFFTIPTHASCSLFMVCEALTTAFIIQYGPFWYTLTVCTQPLQIKIINYSSLHIYAYIKTNPTT